MLKRDEFFVEIWTLIIAWTGIYIHYEVWDELITHSKTSTVQKMMYVDSQMISSHTLLGMWLLIHVGIQVKPWW